MLEMDLPARLITQTDYFHPPQPTDQLAAWYKEWHHFCILGPDVEVILNLNLSGDTRPAMPLGAHVARMVLLVRGQGWDGDVDTFLPRDVLVQSGQIGLRFGQNTLRFRDGTFECSVALRDRPITLMLQLQPVTLPLLMRNNTPIGAGAINWLVVPRLLASGTLIVDRRMYLLRQAPAYHDHNWGRWLWGHDFSWVWGFTLPDQEETPWSLVFDHTTNRSRTQSLELTLALWHGQTLYRVFTQHEIHMRPVSYLTQTPLPKFPRVMALVAPEYSTDIPHQLEVVAASGEDRLSFQFEAGHAAQVVIPNETDLGVTIINEVSGYLRLEGEVRGKGIGLHGKAVFEYLTC